MGSYCCKRLTPSNRNHELLCMKSWKSSTVPTYKKVSLLSDEQHTIFHQLVSLLQPYSHQFDIRKNTDDQYELWTNHHFRSVSLNPKNKRGVLFAGVLIIKRHVGLYLYPLHINPALFASIDEEIKPFWKGNSAFHFYKPLSDLASIKLTQLFDSGCDYYRQNYWIT